MFHGSPPSTSTYSSLASPLQRASHIPLHKSSLCIQTHAGSDNHVITITRDKRIAGLTQTRRKYESNSTATGSGKGRGGVSNAVIPTIRETSFRALDIVRLE